MAPPSWRRISALHAALLHAEGSAAAVVPPLDVIEREFMRSLPLGSATAEARAAEGAHEKPKLYGFVPVVNPAPSVLSAEDIAQYNQRGYTKPIQIYTQAEAAGNRRYFDEMMSTLEAEGRSSYSINGFHVKCKAQWDMATHPKIVAAVADLLGPNFVMWGSHFFSKQPNDRKPVPPHQDAT